MIGEGAENLDIFVTVGGNLGVVRVQVKSCTRAGRDGRYHWRVHRGSKSVAEYPPDAFDVLALAVLDPPLQVAYVPRNEHRRSVDLTRREMAGLTFRRALGLEPPNGYRANGQTALYAEGGR